jgi:hypothetical protein
MPERDLASILERESMSVEPPSDFDRLVRRRDRNRRNRRIGTALLGLGIGVLAVAAVVIAFRGEGATKPAQTPTIPQTFVCPADSAPDRPGPLNQARPSLSVGGAEMAFDPGSGHMVLVPWDVTSGATWTFDVCTNTWVRLSSLPQGMTEGPQDLVYDAGSGLMVAFGRDGAVWTLDPDTGRWTERAGWTNGLRPQVVYDQASQRVIVRDLETSRMWTYDVRTGMAEPIDQGRLVPPVAIQGVGDIDLHHQLFTYDTSADTVVLYLGDGCVGCQRPGQRTWEFDLRSGTWSAEQTETPELNVGLEPSGNEFVYDEANDVSVLFSDGTVAVYNASENEWRELFGGRGLGNGPLQRLGFAMAYDPVNQRIVVTGGQYRTQDGWVPGDDVWAFDVATAEWLRLLGTHDEAS